tara:strand:- start:305 stop:421 length:117 start_codon:yes stop_codon:yes gene_type:complete
MKWKKVVVLFILLLPPTLLFLFSIAENLGINIISIFNR